MHSSDINEYVRAARASYVDPRVIELYRQGETVTLPGAAPADGPAAEREVRRLLKG